MLRQPLPSSASDYARSQRAEIGAAVSAVGRLWSRMGEDFDPSYRTIEQSLLAVVLTAQERIATGAQEYVPAVLAETGQTRAIRPAARASTSPLVGVAGDGRPVEGLLYGAVVHAKQQVYVGQPVYNPDLDEVLTPGPGRTWRQALASSGQWLTRAVGTTLSDTGRQSEALAIGLRPIGGYVRMLNPPSCSRCVILAGARYGSATAFQRHPGCFPAGAVVSGPAPEAATRRWYEGELAVLTTASGKKLTATGNHPVLTDQGWVPAGLIQVGDDVLSSTLGQGAVPLVVPDEKQRPSLIEDVWGADGMVPLGKVPTAAEDFHGDGGHGEVDVVLPDRLLGHGLHASLDELVEEELLTGRVASAASLTGRGPGEQLRFGVRHPADSLVRSGGLALALLGGHLGGPGLPGLGVAADLDALVEQALAQSITADAVAATEAVLALSSLVGAHDLAVGQDAEGPRWDAPAGPLTVHSRVAYASRGADLGGRLSGQVSADRVVKVERVQWSGHVYNLTSAEGWYCADGLIVSNCDCRHIPASESVAEDLTVNPREYLDSLSEAEQDRLLGKAGADAVRSGADLNQVVNARRGMRSAQIGGRNVLVTSEGTTRRGLAYSRLAARGTTQVDAGFATRITRTGPEQRALTRTVARRPRLMPETIKQVATDRGDYLRLLRANGYLR